MTDLQIRRPDAETAPTKYGEPLLVEVDLELDAPWFAIPTDRLGRTIPNFDGEGEPALCFETQGPTAVKALIAGRAAVRDSGLDDHAGPPLRATRAGRGVEASITAGGFQLIYSHLKRGRTRDGSVGVGDVIGESGNTGRCLDGAQRRFVKIAAKSGGAWVRPERFASPITVEAELNATPIGRPTRVPPGERVHRGLRLDPVLVVLEKPELFRVGENDLRVLVKRGPDVVAQASRVVQIDYP